MGFQALVSGHEEVLRDKAKTSEGRRARRMLLEWQAGMAETSVTNTQEKRPAHHEGLQPE